MTAKHSNRPKTNLLTTPGEIRNQIYSYLLPTHETIVIASQRKDSFSSSSSSSSQQHYIGKSLRRDLSTLFLTSKQIYLEASTFFYSNNTFVLPGDATSLPHQAQANLLLRWFLDRIGERNCSNLRRLGIPFPLEGGLGQLQLGDGCEQMIEEEEGAKRKRFISGLVRRCPNLEELEVDLGRGDTPSLAGTAPVPSKMEMAGSVERLLRQSWAGLKAVRVYWGDQVIYKRRRRRARSLEYGMPPEQVPMGEEWVVVNMRDDEEDHARYRERYYERREWRLEDAVHDFYSPYSSINLRSSFALERYRVAARAAEAAPSRDWLSSQHPRIEFAKAFLKSPSRAMSERNEEKEWWRIRRKMAREYTVSYCCTMAGGSSYRTRSKRKRTTTWLRNTLARL
ncbi:uncharacterized protein QC763_700610 [Podospora pseudopauciseta]|uniref:F-box domain-containing protein n=1 Tax=Podospora pseudopauciseta TaxID=2093780 RepID=A0ABR0H351_9PEZI|nr:hypothetical protein QC763_700610 [Podospora pseudopauciseta]